MKKAILFLHGWGGDENSFASIAPFFKKHYNCVFIRFPTDPPEPWCLDNYANLVMEKINQQGIDKCHIIAHSFGARVASLLLNHYPKRFDRIVLTGPAGIPKHFSLWLWLKIRFNKLFRRKNAGSSDYRKLTSIGKQTFKNIIGRDLRPEIRQIVHKTLIIWGNRDKAIPRYMVKLWTNLNTNTKLITYKGNGHFCFIDSPTRFIIDTQEFLSEVNNV